MAKEKQGKGNIFQQFSNCLNNKPYDESIGFSSFMFCRYLSFSPQTIHSANNLNYYYNIPDQLQYEYIRNSPHPKFIRWIGTNKKIPSNDELDRIQRKYKCNTQIALDYYDILTKGKK